MENIRKKVRSFLLGNYLFTEDESALDNDVSFLESGLVDSTGMMEVIFFIEETFSISVDDVEMVPENLDSVENLVAFVARKQGVAA
ncbi:MAG: acyl carrier protein [Gammaproteobacteria bacterium]|jgi:acyl carrier protein|nr:acyl carrier protein [Gammaproteobacteria bacterium]MBQ0775849.1 acyl carrier protein [Gammaproteobacteria bacterium]|tara:strand:+ start:83696 stop:83953 length:258 start_codon:yes stop_codon:yes gene_type:complete